jgi:hypothetical protein
MDRIFLFFFTAFIATVAPAAVVVASIFVPEGESLAGSVVIDSTLEEKAQLLNKSVAIVKKDDLIPEEQTINNNVKIDISPIAGAQPLVVLTPEQFKALISQAIKEGLKPLPEKAKPLWRQMVSLTISGIKLPHQLMMMLPAGSLIEKLVILHLIVTYKPELITWATKLSPSLMNLLISFGTNILSGTVVAVLDGVLPKLSPEAADWLTYLMPKKFWVF